MRTPGTLYQHADVEHRFLLLVSESHYLQITDATSIRIFEDSTISLMARIEYFWKKLK